MENEIDIKIHGESQKRDVIITPVYVFSKY